MNKGQKVLAGLIGLVAVELLPVTVVSTRMLLDGISMDVTYEVDDAELDEVETELSEAEKVAEHDMREEGLKVWD